MDYPACPSLILERIIAQTAQWVKQHLIPLSSAVLVGLISHMFAFVNKLPNCDEAGSLFNKGTTTSSGRWGLDLSSFLFPDVSVPWFYGIISLILFAVAACFIIQIFAVHNKLLQALLAGSITAFPSLTATVIFMYTLAPYALSFFLSVAAVRLLQKKGWKRFLFALLCMVFSLGIYQSYIAVAASLLVLLLIQKTLVGEDVLLVIRHGILYLFFLIASLAAYYLITQVVNRLSGIALNDYADTRICFSLSYLPTGIYEAYRAFFHFFTSGLWGLTPTIFSRSIHIVSCLSIMGLLVLWFSLLEKKEWIRIILLLVLLILLPLAINALYLFVVADPAMSAIHTLVLFSYIAIYVFAVVVLEVSPLPGSMQKLRISLFCQNLVTMGMAIIICINMYIANATYLSLHLRYENTYAFFTTLLADLKTRPEFDGTTEIAICGKWQDPNFYWNELPFTYNIMGADGIQPHRGASDDFVQYYLGVRLPLLSRSETYSIMETEEYIQMPCYPYYGSMKMIDGKLVVKLS